MLRRLYDWVMRLAGSRRAGLWLALLSFAEGVFFPIPPDVLLMPMVLARREGVWRYASVTVVASVLGGCTGYTIGHFLQPVGIWLLTVTGYGDKISFIQDHSAWLVVLIALPIPYKLTAIASGLGSLNFAIFLAASLIMRGLRFFLVAALVWRYGAPIQAFVEKRLALVVSGVALALVALFAALKFIH
jgi:membrane protein YqaA with SNARE-associated domain